MQHAALRGASVDQREPHVRLNSSTYVVGQVIRNAHVRVELSQRVDHQRPPAKNAPLLRSLPLVVQVGGRVRIARLERALRMDAHAVNRGVTPRRCALGRRRRRRRRRRGLYCKLRVTETMTLSRHVTLQNRHTSVVLRRGVATRLRKDRARGAISANKVQVSRCCWGAERRGDGQAKPAE